MNPQIDSTQGLHLPQPANQQGSLQVPSAPMQPARGIPVSQAYAVAPTQAPIPQVAPIVEETVPPLAGQSDQAAAQIDEEWVAKAKDIVAQTGVDPYAQSKGLARIKAQYLKARYDKDIKIGKD
jgi:hypothetical protein